MANNKRNSNIKIKQIEVIENNIKLVEILHFIFQGQILDLDLKEFCLHFGLYQTENQYNTVIKNLITNKIIKTKKLVKTNNNVLIATAPVYNFFGLEGKTTRYSVETVTRNSYTNYIIINKISIDINDDIQAIATFLKNNTTLLSKKRDVESCYKPFNDALTEQGREAKIDALRREEKRKSKLNNIEKVELKNSNGIEYTETLQTLRERDIYVLKTNDKYKLYITDNNSTYTLSNLSDKIGTVIRVLGEQITELDNLSIVVVVKDNPSKKRLERNFTSKYADGLKVHIDKSITKAIKKHNYNFKIDYKLKGSTKKGVYVLENIYKTETLFKTIRIKVEGTNIAYKHNSDLKAQALVEHQQEKKKQSQREEIIEELRREGVIK